MKLQIRFLLLLIIIFGGVVSITVVQYLFDLDRSKHILTSELEQRQQYFNNIRSLEGSSLQTLAEDYSFWDEMVDFVKTNNTTFAQQTLDTGLETHNADASWVYRPDGTLLYHGATTNDDSLKDLGLSAAFFKKLASSKFLHFYQQTDEGVLEIRAATIVPSNDPDHATTPQGYWVIGRILDDQHLKSLATLTQSNVELNSSSSSDNRITNDAVSFAVVLSDWSGTPIGNLRSTSSVPVVDDLNHSYTEQLQLLIGLIIALAILLGISLWWFVLRPVNTITVALRSQNPQHLNRLALSKTEFGNLAQTVQAFFQQKLIIAQAEFRKTELEKLNKEKAAFLAVTAHELNGPVSNVRIFADYLTFLFKKKADVQAIEQQLQRISHQTTKINMLINDLREASQGKPSLQLNKRAFDFDSFLQEEVEEAAFTVKHKLILTGKTRKTLISDPDRLGQVVTNLIRNAYKYSLDASEIYINSKVENNEIIVGVQDFGIGISPEDKEHIFTRFYRSNSVANTFPGLGLGLAVSKQIIEELGGRIWVESTLEKGSIFYFSLPLGFAPTSPQQK